MPTVLYAEDDRDCRELFSFILRQHDFTVYEANNGSQAVRILREEQVDLAILDVRMPMMSGYDTARMVAQQEGQVPIIFLSAKGLTREIDKGFGCGPMVVDYLIKPVSPNDLIGRVTEVLYGCQERGLAAIREENLAQLAEGRQQVLI
ncbi:MAG: response regulator [Chloroflexota bacterium]